MSPESVKERTATAVPKRRDFLQYALHTLSSVMGLALAVPVVRYLFPPEAHKHPAKWIDAGDIANLKRDVPQTISFSVNRQDGWKVVEGRETAWVTSGKNGQLQAFSPRCTHLGCAYAWDQTAGAFACPCHGSRFDRDGNVLVGPATRSLDKYPVKVEAGRLWLALEQGEDA